MTKPNVVTAVRGSRPDVVEAARGWLGTPYRHQASVRGWGADCLGLLRGVWRERVGPEPEPTPAYRPDWAEVGAEETLLLAARRRLREIALAEARAGDVLLFRMTPDACVKHCAILSEGALAPEARGRIVHAYWGRAVVESWLHPWWRRRATHAFAFPPSETTGS